MELILYVDIYEWNRNFMIYSLGRTIMLDEISVISSSVYEMQSTSMLHFHGLFFGDQTL